VTESTGDGSPSPVDPALAGAPVPWPEPIEPAPPAPIPPAAPIPSAPTRGRFIDHGAIVAGWVGVGMASTIAISFLLVIPIEPIYWLFAPLAGLLIGYYANQRSLTPRGAWLRILVDALYAGVVTGVTLVLFLLMVKALFFYADSGYPSFNRVDAQGQPTPPYCVSGPGCVYARYLADGRGAQLEAAGVTDVATFTGLYWQQQFATAGLVLVLAVVGSAFGGFVYGVTRPKDV
jgi:hypothetical protein